MRLTSVAGALFDRFSHVGEGNDLDEAVALARAALDAAPPGHWDRPDCASKLSLFLQRRFQFTSVRADMDEAVAMGRLSVSATSEWSAAFDGMEHSQRAMHLSNLGNRLRMRFDAFASVADLDEAVAMGTASVEASASDDPFLPVRLFSLTGTLQIRFARYGAVADLDQAVATAREAVELSEPGNIGRELALSNLGLALRARYDRSGARADLDEAADVMRAAVAATPEDEPGHLAGNVANLSIVLYDLYERSGELADLDTAIGAARRALDTSPTPDPMYLVGLGAGLRARFNHSHAVPDLEEATAVLRAAVAAPPEDQLNRSANLSTLGRTLHSRYEHSGVPADLDEAIDIQRAAVRSAPEDSPGRASYLSLLADLLRLRFDSARRDADAREAVARYREAVGTVSAPPSTRVAAGRAAATHFGTLFPLDVAEMLDTVVRLLPELAARHLERSDQQHALHTSATGLASDAAALTLERTGMDVTERTEHALRLLEAGRAVLLSQSLDTRSDLTDLRLAHPDLAQRYVDLRELLDREEPEYQVRWVGADEVEPDNGWSRDPQADRRAAAAEFESVLGKIRGMPGFAGFARLPDVRELATQAEAGPVITVNVSRYRSDALLLTPGGVRAVPLPGLDPAALADRTKLFQRALTDISGESVVPATGKPAQSTLCEVLAWLWDVVAEPVVEALGFVKVMAPDELGARVWWATGGALSLLPLHAAGYHGERAGGRAVIDRVVSSYTPTIRALDHARQQAALAAADGSERPAGSLIVAMPTTPGLGEAAALPSALREANRLAEKLPAPYVLRDGDPRHPAGNPSRTPTHDSVLDGLRTCAIAHFACHGRHYPDDPSRSTLLLHDHATRPLTVARVSRIRLEHVRLAYLSACRTAYQGTELPDESVHLASAFQLAGFPHVIATLWEIVDSSARTIATTFYDRLRDASDSDALDTDRAAHALHSAVRDLRRRRPDPFLWSAHVHAGA